MAPNLRDRRKLTRPVRLSSELHGGAASVSSQAVTIHAARTGGEAGESSSSQRSQHISVRQMNEAPTRGQPARGVKRGMINGSTAVIGAAPRANNNNNGTGGRIAANSSTSSSSLHRHSNESIIHDRNLPVNAMDRRGIQQPSEDRRVVTLEHLRMIVPSSSLIQVNAASSSSSNGTAAVGLPLQVRFNLNPSSATGILSLPTRPLQPQPAMIAPPPASASLFSGHRRHYAALRPSHQASVRPIASFLPHLKFPTNEERAQAQNEVREKLLKYVTLEEMPYVSNCVKAAVFRGHLRLVPTFDSDGKPEVPSLDRQQHYSLSCFACKGIVDVSLRQLLFQPDKISSPPVGLQANNDDRIDTADNGGGGDLDAGADCAASTPSPPLNRQRFTLLQQQEIRCGECSLRNAVADFCTGRPYLCNPRKFRHCSACPNWGICTEDRDSQHCGKCHAHSVMPCVNCGSCEYIKPQSSRSDSLPAQSKKIVVVVKNATSNRGHLLPSSMAGAGEQHQPGSSSSGSNREFRMPTGGMRPC